MTKPRSIFERYPRLENLRGKVPDSIIEREIGEKIERFEHNAPFAAQMIRSVFLDQLFPAELESGKITLERFLGQWGNITVEEVCKIALIAAWLKPRRVFEFGTYNGMTTRQIALNTPADCRIVTMDVIPDSSEAAALEIGEIDSYLAKKCGAFRFRVGEYFLGTQQEAKIEQIWGDTLSLDVTPFMRQMDLVFVDAGHTYRYIKSDTENAVKMLAPGGGVILWHDYMQVLHPDVTQYLLERAQSGMRISHLRGTALAVHRAPA